MSRVVKEEQNVTKSLEEFKFSDFSQGVINFVVFAKKKERKERLWHSEEVGAF